MEYLIGSNGAIYAIRKELFKRSPTEKAITDDLYITLEVLEENYKFAYESSAIAYEETGKSVIDEFRRKIRFSATNFQTSIYFKNLLFSKIIYFFCLLVS